MTLYQKFRNLNIDHSAIGLDQSDTDVTYYCTPRNAEIIGTGISPPARSSIYKIVNL